MNKFCTKCKEIKDVEQNFGRSKNTKDGFSCWCKNCRSLFDTSWKYTKTCIDCGKYTQGKRCVPCATKARIKNRVCSIEGCKEKHHTKGYCIKHFSYFYNRKLLPYKKCKIEYCTNVVQGYGYCVSHLYRFKKGLDVDKNNNFNGKLRRGNGGWVTDKGYKMIACPCHPNSTKDGFILEHRLIMEIYLERILSKEEVVHHKNKNRLDNRIENLELFKNRSEHSKHHFSIKT